MMFITDEKIYKKIRDRYFSEFRNKIDNDITGECFIHDYFDYYLSSVYIRHMLNDRRNNDRKNLPNIKSMKDALNYLEIDEDTINSDERFYTGLKKALEKHKKDMETLNSKKRKKKEFDIC